MRESELPVLVDFWAPWCMPCRMMAPTLDELSEKMDSKIKVAKVDTENQEGIWAAGDITTNSNSFRQIIIACAEGAIAAENIFKFLSQKN